MNIPTHKLNAEALYAQLREQVKQGLAGIADPAIVGIHSGGAWIAERLAEDLGIAKKGFIDVSFYRDDYAERGLHGGVKSTKLNFAADGATIVLVDDVLYTGRTTRAAINELFDYGRPARILLAALADRGGRELPVAADFVATTVTLADGEQLVLRRADDGILTFTVDHV